MEIRTQNTKRYEHMQKNFEAQEFSLEGDILKRLEILYSVYLCLNNEKLDVKETDIDNQIRQIESLQRRRQVINDKILNLRGELQVILQADTFCKEDLAGQQKMRKAEIVQTFPSKKTIPKR